MTPDSAAENVPDHPPAPPPPLRARRWAPLLWRAAGECALIVFSVVLALWVSGLADERKTAAKVREARQYLAGEMQANRAVLADPRIFDHHQRLLGAFRAASANKDDRAARRAAFDALFATGFHPAPLRDAIWRSVTAGDVLANMPMREVMVVADVYRQQDLLVRLNEEFLRATPQVIAVRDDANDRVAVDTVQMQLSDIVTAEQQLLKLYDDGVASFARKK